MCSPSSVTMNLLDARYWRTGKRVSEPDLDIALEELRNAIDWVKDAEENPPTSKEVMEFLPSLQPLMKQQTKRGRDAQ
jgi:ribosome maturation protein Sdo1